VITEHHEQELHRLAEMICPNSIKEEVSGLGDCRLALQLRYPNEQAIAQVEAWFGNPYGDEPNGYSAYHEWGWEWTSAMETVEEVAADIRQQIEDRSAEG
jgi:hypothetical protein